MPLDKSIHLFAKEFNFPTKFLTVLVKLSKKYSISANYSESLFKGLIKDPLKHDFTESSCSEEIGLLRICISPIDKREEIKFLTIRITDNVKENQKIFYEATEQLKEICGIEYPNDTIMKDEANLLKQIIAEIKHRGEFEIDIPKFVDIL